GGTAPALLLALGYLLSTFYDPHPPLTDGLVQRLPAQRFPVLTNPDISMHGGTPSQLDYIEGIFPTVKQLAAIHLVLSFLLGIGDRHPYNILVSLNTLEIVHTEFGICFGRGKLLKTPELVPF
ncbi:hypothetical protein MJO28_006817, partial [Puccinia striiformis f. sp. tritici]